MMGMRVYWRKRGGHVHMRVFIRGGKMGDLCCREEEFETVQAAMLACEFRKDFREPFEEEEGDADRND